MTAPAALDDRVVPHTISGTAPELGAAVDEQLAPMTATATNGRMARTVFTIGRRYDGAVSFWSRPPRQIRAFTSQ
jgi:hypothetical protein